jgi:hypothetical protein
MIACGRITLRCYLPLIRHQPDFPSKWVEAQNTCSNMHATAISLRPVMRLEAGDSMLSD